MLLCLVLVVFATMMMVALVVLGLFSYDRLGVDQFPNVDVPVVLVTTAYAGASTETVEIEVTKPIEEALNTIGGIEEVASTSYEGRSVVIASFKLEVESANAAQDVRDKVAALNAELPDEADTPVVSRFNPSDEPVLSVVINSTSLDVPDLTSLAERRLVRALATVSGVGQVALIGGQEQQVAIRLDEARLNALGIGVNEVVDISEGGLTIRPGGCFGPIPIRAYTGALLCRQGPDLAIRRLHAAVVPGHERRSLAREPSVEIRRVFRLLVFRSRGGRQTSRHSRRSSQEPSELSLRCQTRKWRRRCILER
nr:efflux RND transporter permease subunit [Sinorhizobium meliloti]